MASKVLIIRTMNNRFIDYTNQVIKGRKFIKFENGKWLVRCENCEHETWGKSSNLIKHGCHCSWKNTVNENYFDIIDNSEKAYFLGFLFADGYINHKFKSCKIDLQECDVDILEKFKNAINFSGKITEYIAKKGYSYRSKESVVKRIYIINDHLSNVLENKGVHPHREDEGFPYSYVPEKYYMDFIRGYFDGNGSISIYNTIRGFSTNICGGTKLLNDIGNILKGYNINFHYNPRRAENPHNTQLFISTQLGQIKFLDLIYKQATVYLDRKYNKYLKLKALTL